MNISKILLIALTITLAKADTVTTQDSRTWNGTIKTMQYGILTLSAAFPSGSAILTFGSDYIRAIEFNTLAYNPGANPVNALPKPNPNPKTLPGMIYRKLKKTEKPISCQDITAVAADARNIQCGTTSVPRSDVVRILVGPQ